MSLQQHSNVGTVQVHSVPAQWHKFSDISGVAIGCAECAMHTGPAALGPKICQRFFQVKLSVYKNKFENSFTE